MPVYTVDEIIDELRSIRDNISETVRDISFASTELNARGIANLRRQLISLNNDAKRIYGFLDKNDPKQNRVSLAILYFDKIQSVVEKYLR